jgi:hypothetical protein
MIKDVMVYLDGSAADEVRLAAVADIAEYFDSHVVGLFLNVLPLIVPSEMDGISMLHVQELVEQARKRGDTIGAMLINRLRQLRNPAEIRRFDVYADNLPDVAAREARSVDTFVALRPSGARPRRALCSWV